MNLLTENVDYICLYVLSYVCYSNVVVEKVKIYVWHNLCRRYNYGKFVYNFSWCEQLLNSLYNLTRERCDAAGCTLPSRPLVS